MSDETFGRITDDMAKLGSAYPTATLKLSPMERKILEHLAEGMSNQEIADALGIGFETVRERAFGIRARLGARNAAHAVALGFRAGILR